MDSKDLQSKNNNIADETMNCLEKAQNAAIKFITDNFQRPEQLENLENIRRRVMVQKATIDEQLKISLRYYTNGIRNGIKELQQSSNDVLDVKKSLDFINQKCKEFTGLESELKEVKSVANNMSYLNKAVLLLNQLFEVPGVISKTKIAISNDKWLEAHKDIRELENIRDTLCLEHMRSTHSLGGRAGSNPDDWPLSKYFAELITLRRALWDKIFEVIDDLNRIAVESPIKLVNALRIIEREEIVDEFWLAKKNEYKGFMPIFRPLKYKRNAFESIASSIYAKVRLIRTNTDPSDKEYINLVFTQIRNIVLNDIKLLKNSISKCFPPHYNILSFYTMTYHQAIQSEIENIIKESTEEMQHRYAIPILIWDRDYIGESFFGDKELGQEVYETIIAMGSLLSSQLKGILYNCYITSLYKTMTDYTTNAVNIESNDWRSNKVKPDCYNNLFQTMLPTLLSQTVLSSLESAGSFGFDVKFKVFKVFLSSIENCIEKYTKAFEEYSRDNFNASKIITNYNNHNIASDVIIPPTENGWNYFIEYTIAISNNCYQLLDGVKALLNQIVSDSKKVKSSITDTANDEIILGEDNTTRIANIRNSIISLSNYACSMIVKDFSTSMQEAFNSLFTDDWKNNSEGWGDGFYCAIEDFSLVLLNLNENGRLVVWEGIDRWIATQYIQMLCRMKLKIRDRNEKIMIGDQMSCDIKRLMGFFKNSRTLDNDEDLNCYATSVCVDLFKCRDISFVRFDLTKLCTLYSDFTEEHAFNLLSIRGDMSKEAIKTQINEIDFNENSSSNRKYGIFKQITPIKSDIFSVFTII